MEIESEYTLISGVPVHGGTGPSLPRWFCRESAVVRFSESRSAGIRYESSHMKIGIFPELDDNDIVVLEMEYQLPLETGHLGE